MFIIIHSAAAIFTGCEQEGALSLICVMETVEIIILAAGKFIALKLVFSFISPLLFNPKS